MAFNIGFYAYAIIGPDMGRITLESNALNEHYLPKMCIELALFKKVMQNFEKVMHWISII